MPFSRRAALTTAGGLAAAAGLAACSDSAPAAAPATGTSTPAAAPQPGQPPSGRGQVTIVGHRGASGYRPEHTASSYSLAARMGADAVDVDLCSTKDGKLVARHEPEIGGTTDVARHPEFANRRRTVVIDGTSYDGWFTVDFTLAELKTLRAVERIPATRPHNTLYDGRDPLLTFDEVLDLLDELSRELNRRVGVLPEVKHSTWHASVGVPVEPALVEVLRRRGLAEDPQVIIQSFEVANLKALKSQVACPLLQLVDSGDKAPADFVAARDPRTFDDLVSARGLQEVATYATWIGPTKERVIAPTGVPTTLAGDARAAGLRTMPYTFRNENEFLPPPQQRNAPGAPKSTYGDAFGEYAQYRALGIEGLFSDNPDTAIAAWS
ncbi:glycerophosphodiester phosphodiesterase family protein [Actinomycetospora termitidis]|uniref:glycerophosphodiester phosphodiesterase n=1 Tax=Actinomycetospora termitidis TaxID=3053470 RepID=A0ABT7M331_9PSEU|nr:glycerophosphodiester phosphodiesterase family protein [Actinomycetospora sp. Odt1-22]MDL5155075.1 glycerophosphodiester phosphodiesterase family protein [Actinomycetospora sp. Odt1-22]